MPIQVAAEAITDRLTAGAYTLTIESREFKRSWPPSKDYERDGSCLLLARHVFCLSRMNRFAALTRP